VEIEERKSEKNVVEMIWKRVFFFSFRGDIDDAGISTLTISLGTTSFFA
jgi:hypothetical protein